MFQVEKYLRTERFSLFSSSKSLCLYGLTRCSLLLGLPSLSPPVPCSFKRLRSLPLLSPCSCPCPQFQCCASQSKTSGNLLAPHHPLCPLYSVASPGLPLDPRSVGVGSGRVPPLAGHCCAPHEGFYGHAPSHFWPLSCRTLAVRCCI